MSKATFVICRFSAAAIALGAGMAVTAPANADAVYNGTIYRLGGAPVGSHISAGATMSTIDHIAFTVHTAGVITMDVLSWEEFGGAAVDVNGDGEIAFIDPLIMLFRNDGSLGWADFVEQNDDDDGDDSADGSIDSLDSYLSLNLAAGDYILAIGGYDFNISDAINGFNPGTGDGFFPATFTDDYYVHDHGDYRVTFTGDVSLSGMTAVPALAPVPAALVGLCGVAGLRRRR